MGLSTWNEKRHGRTLITITFISWIGNVDNNTRILLVDDKSINRKIAQSFLKTLGYKADEVVDGLEAVTALEMINYGLVLMDLCMPKMDGFEATSIIRAGYLLPRSRQR